MHNHMTEKKNVREKSVSEPTLDMEYMHRKLIKELIREIQ